LSDAYLRLGFADQPARAPVGGRHPALPWRVERQDRAKEPPERRENNRMLKSMVLAGLAAAALAPSLASAQPMGAYNEDNYGPPPGVQAAPNEDLTVWQNRHNTRAREEWMEERIRHRVGDGALTQDQANRDLAHLHEIRAMDDGFRQSGGGELTFEQRRQINQRLEHLADMILAEENSTAAAEQ
jgi:hypothetical protein